MSSQGPDPGYLLQLRAARTTDSRFPPSQLAKRKSPPVRGELSLLRSRTVTDRFRTTIVAAKLRPSHVTSLKGAETSRKERPASRSEVAGLGGWIMKAAAENGGECSPWTGDSGFSATITTSNPLAARCQRGRYPKLKRSSVGKHRRSRWLSTRWPSESTRRRTTPAGQELRHGGPMYV